MRKALFAALMLFAMQEPSAETFVVDVPDGLSYALYEDAACTKEVLADGEPVTVSVEEGKLMIPVAYEGMWLKETKTKEGYYPSEEPVEIKEDMEFVQEPIEYVISLLPEGEVGEGFVFEIVDEEGNATEVTIEESLDIGPYLSAGETFVLREKSVPEEYVLNGDVTIEVPLEKPEEALHLDLVYERKTVLLFKGDTDSGAGIMLYQDEAGTEPLKEDGYYHMDEKICLDAGTYWYRIEEIGEMYYENKTMYRLDIDPSAFQYMEETVPVERVKFVVQMEESPYILHVYHDGKETAAFQADGRAHVLYGVRESTYTIRAEALHDAYDLADMVVETGAVNEENKLVLKPHPFVVHARILDSYQNTFLAGTIVVKDDAGQEVTRVKTDGGYAKITGLSAGHTYWLEALETGSIHPLEGVKLVVEGSEIFNLDVPAVTFVSFSLTTKDKDALFSLYQDEDCTIAAHDQNNNLLEDVTQGTYTLMPGTYFLKQTAFGNTYYRNSAVQKLEVTGNLSKEIPADEVRVVLGGREGENVLSDIQLELWEEGEVIERWQGEKTFVLERGKVYTLRQSAPLSGYLTAEERLFSTPVEKPEEALSYHLQAEAYTILTLSGEENAGAMLYTDEACMSVAYTVDGLVAEVHMDGSGIKRLRMPRGSYYLLETGGAGFYDMGEIRKIELSSSYAEASLSPVPVTFSVRFLDASGLPVQGASFSLRDEAGNVLEEWNSGEEAYEIKVKLLAGGAYIIHQDKAPDGYERMKTDIVYTTPLSAPDNMPVLTIEAKQYDPSLQMDKTDAVKDMEEVRNEKRNMYFYAAAGVGFVILLGLVLINRHKKR